MPGFIDSHVHLSGETSKNRYIEEFTLNDEDYGDAAYANNKCCTVDMLQKTDELL